MISEATSHAVSAPTAEIDRRVSAQESDCSSRAAVLALFTGGVFWLVISSLLGVLTSVKLHAPGMLANAAWLTYGRLRPAQTDLFIYGFALPVALGSALWLLARLGRTRLAGGGFVAFAAFLWNVGVLAGFLGILAGASTGFEWFEFPLGVNALLMVAYLVIAVSALVTFHGRRETVVYPSVWFIVAALFWFPWIFATANYLLLRSPVRGMAQMAIDYWYQSQLRLGVLTPLALAAVLYFIPKISGRPLYSRALNIFAFWILLIFGSFAAVPGGVPLPAWLIEASNGARVLVALGSLAVAVIWWNSKSSDGEKGMAPAGFFCGAVISYLFFSLAQGALSFESLGTKLDFSLVQAGLASLELYGFVGLALFGAIYYIGGTLLGTKSAEMNSTGNFWLAAIGVVVITAGLAMGGLVQANGWTGGKPFIDVVKSTTPWIGINTLGVLLFAMGNILLALNYFGAIGRACRSCCQCFETGKGAKR
jgi:cytochrome c oxidase cbb3-type subunit 1